MQDADQIVAECSDLIAKHSIDASNARHVVVKAMLGDQPLPLNRAWRPVTQGASGATASLRLLALCVTGGAPPNFRSRRTSCRDEANAGTAKMTQSCPSRVDSG